MNNQFLRSSSTNIRSTYFYSAEIERREAVSREGGSTQRLRNNSGVQNYNRIVPIYNDSRTDEIYT